MCARGVPSKYAAEVARWLLVTAFFGPITSWGAAWSSCQTITSVVEQTAFNNSFYVNLAPGVSGCAADTSGEVLYRIGMAGVTTDTYRGLIASTLAAFLTGKQVMVFYDASQAPTCFASIIAIGGYANQCN